MRVWLALAVAVTGCVATEELLVSVQTTGKKPIAGATVACTCEPDGNAGGVTGADGVARLVLFANGHEPCVVTVFAPGYVTRQVKDVAPCGADVGCHAIDLEVELEVGPP